MKLMLLYHLSALLFLLGTIPGGHGTTSNVFNTHIKIYDAHWTYNSDNGTTKNYTNPLYLYEIGTDQPFQFRNYYLAQASVGENATEPAGEKPLHGAHSVAPSREVFSMSFTRTSTKGNNCCWNVKNTHTGDALLNISKYQFIRSPSDTNTIRDLTTTWGNGSHYVNKDISIVYGGVNKHNESYFYMTFEHANETLYLNAHQTTFQLGFSDPKTKQPAPYGELGAIRDSLANMAPFDLTVRWVFTNPILAHYIRANQTVVAFDPTPASLQAVKRTDGWLVHSFENYACATRNVQTAVVDIATCVKSCANYTYMTFYRGDTRTHNCECANTCHKTTAANHAVLKPAIYTRIPVVANWTIYDSSTVKSCDAPSNRTSTSSAHACAQHCAAFAYMTFINYDKSPSGVATSTCTCHATCNAVTLASNQQRQPVMYKNLQPPSIPSGGGSAAASNSIASKSSSGSSSTTEIVIIAVVVAFFAILISVGLLTLCPRKSSSTNIYIRGGQRDAAYSVVKTFVV